MSANDDDRRRPERCAHCRKCGRSREPMSRGSQLLRAFLEDHDLSTAQLSRLTGLDRGSIKSWLTRVAPSRAHALVLELRLQIPLAAWFQPPHTHLDSQRGRANKPTLAPEMNGGPS